MVPRSTKVGILKMIQESKNIFSTTSERSERVVFFNFLKDTNPPILELSLVYLAMTRVMVARLSVL